MKSPKEWCQFEWENPLMSTGDFIAEIQKETYNQAIDDALNNIEYINYDEHGQYDPQIDKDSILKLKIK